MKTYSGRGNWRVGRHELIYRSVPATNGRSTGPNVSIRRANTEADKGVHAPSDVDTRQHTHRHRPRLAAGVQAPDPIHPKTPKPQL